MQYSASSHLLGCLGLQGPYTQMRLAQACSVRLVVGPHSKTAPALLTLAWAPPPVQAKADALMLKGTFPPMPPWPTFSGMPASSSSTDRRWRRKQAAIWQADGGAPDLLTWTSYFTALAHTMTAA